MSLHRFRIAALSRDPRFLLRTVWWILLPGLAVALGISLRRSAEIEKTRAMVAPEWAWIRKLIENRPVTSRRECVKLLEEVRLSSDWHREFLHTGNPRKGLPPTIPGPERILAAAAFLTPVENDLLPAYVAAYAGRAVEAEALPPFADAAAADPASGFVGSMYGDLVRIRGEYDAALAAYQRGAVDAEAGADCRRRALDLCRRRDWKEKLRKLYADPEWRAAVLESGAGDYTDNYQVAQAAGDWTGVLRIVWDSVWVRLKSPLWMLMSSLCGLLWFLIVHMGAGVPVRMWWRGLLAFGCGLLSIPLTHVFIIVQDLWFGPQEHSMGSPDIFYCISGIGLREELAKLLLFAPLLILLRKAPAAHVLATAASVGLGFAILENVTYFEWGEAASVWPRFITANFLHFSLTGLSGLALWQAIRNSAWLSHFAVVFTGAILLHGLWDFTPQDTRLAGDYVFFMYALLAGLALYFFRELLRYSQPQPGVPSATLVYLAGGAIMLTVLMSATSWDLGFRQALLATFEPVLQLFAIGAAMYYQLRRA
jgi:RsiW-degrading membrane proteinase PrsW (M82 family)